MLNKNLDRKTIFTIFDIFNPSIFQSDINQAILRSHPDRGGNNEDFIFFNNCKKILRSNFLIEKYKEIIKAYMLEVPSILNYELPIDILDLYSSSGTEYTIKIKYNEFCNKCLSTYQLENKKYFIIDPECPCDRFGKVEKKIKCTFIVNSKTSFDNNIIRFNSVLINVFLKIKNPNYFIESETGKVSYYINISHNDYIEGFTRLNKLPFGLIHETKFNKNDRIINPLIFKNKGIRKRILDSDQTNSIGDFFLYYIIN